jgi:hypothetical protein
MSAEGDRPVDNNLQGIMTKRESTESVTVGTLSSGNTSCCAVRIIQAYK